MTTATGTASSLSAARRTPTGATTDRKAPCEVDLVTYQDGEMANLAKTMPLACCPPAFVLSHGGGLFSTQTSEKSCFYANRLERQNGFFFQSAKRATPQGQCRASRARTNGSDGSARWPIYDFDGWFASATMAPEASTLRPKRAARRRLLKCPIQKEALQPTPDIEPPQVPSATASKLMDQLDELTSDLAAKGHSSSEEVVETIPRTPTFLPNRKSWSLQFRCLRALISDKALHSRRAPAGA